MVRRTRWAPAQRVRVYRQWSDENEELFLDCLAASCNVGIACEQADVCHTTVYRQRRMRADFAAKWQAALEQGYARLEMALLRSAADSMEGIAFDGDRPIPAMSAETALAVLRHHRASVTGEGKKSGWRARPKRLDEVRASIIRKLDAIERGDDPSESPTSVRPERSRGASARAYLDCARHEREGRGRECDQNPPLDPLP